MKVNDRVSLVVAGIISMGTIFGVVGLSGIRKESKSQSELLESKGPSMKPSDF